MTGEKIFEMKAINELTKDEFIQKSIDDWRNYANNIIEEVQNVKFKQIKLLSYFSIVESIAQDMANYPKMKQQKAFTDFVLKYQKGYDFLSFTDPITLYYRFEEELKEDVSLDEYLDDGGIYHFNCEALNKLIEKIRNTLLKTKSQDSINKIMLQHRYVDLLYRLRCKVSHEFSDNHISDFDVLLMPYYINCSRIYLKDNKIVNDEVWELRMPIRFIKELCLNCINNYLDECQKNKELPLENDTLNRKSQLSWYQE